MHSTLGLTESTYCKVELKNTTLRYISGGTSYTAPYVTISTTSGNINAKFKISTDTCAETVSHDYKVRCYAANNTVLAVSNDISVASLFTSV